MFTLGSLIPVSSMPAHFQQIFARVFARIPQRIFWKLEKGSIQEQITDNIMVVDWLPQQDLLGGQ